MCEGQFCVCFRSFLESTPKRSFEWRKDDMCVYPESGRKLSNIHLTISRWIPSFSSWMKPCLSPLKFPGTLSTLWPPWERKEKADWYWKGTLCRATAKRATWRKFLWHHSLMLFPPPWPANNKTLTSWRLLGLLRPLSSAPLLLLPKFSSETSQFPPSPVRLQLDVLAPVSAPKHLDL